MLIASGSAVFTIRTKDQRRHNVATKPSANCNELERGLTDEKWAIRAAWCNRTDFTPTLEQIERGLADKSAEVRNAWVRNAWLRRNDIRLTKEQIESAGEKPF